MTSVFQAQRVSHLKDILSEGSKITEKAFSQTYQEGLHILPNMKDINVKTFSLFKKKNELTIIKEALGEMDFDFLIFDTSPNFELQTMNALVASDAVLIPVKYDLFSLEGLSTVKQYVDKIQEHVNPDLKNLGILATHVDMREGINKPIREKIERAFEMPLWIVLLGLILGLKPLK
ncbi:MAG: AAA family ATPase [Thermales bacterium]|nr:AAA family ATPase [Thermales bacterium]